MLDSSYTLTLKLLRNLFSGVNKLRFGHYVCNVVMDVIYNVTKNGKPQVVYQF